MPVINAKLFTWAGLTLGQKPASKHNMAIRLLQLMHAKKQASKETKKQLYNKFENILKEQHTVEPSELFEILSDHRQINSPKGYSKR